MPWTHLTADICRLIYLFLQSNEKDNFDLAPSATKNSRSRKSRRSTRSRRAKSHLSAVDKKTRRKDRGAPQSDK
jgi:hypothetical protein